MRTIRNILLIIMATTWAEVTIETAQNGPAIRLVEQGQMQAIREHFTVKKASNITAVIQACHSIQGMIDTVDTELCDDRKECKTIFENVKQTQEKPDMFGIEGAKSILQARLEAEQNGWVKLELKPNPLPAAIVVALNIEQAWKGAKILARYRDVSTWSVLLIKTNKNTSSLKGDQIPHFIQTGDVEGASPVTNVEKLA